MYDDKSLTTLLDFQDEIFQYKSPTGLVRWTETKRMISATSSSEPGPFNLDRTPYLRGVLEALDDDCQEEIYVMKATQVGASEAAMCNVGYLIDEKPCNIMYLLPNMDMAKKVSTQRIEPLINEHSFLKEKMISVAKKTDNKLVKLFEGGILTMTHSGSSSAIRSIPIKYAIADEASEFSSDLNNQGGVIEILRGRFSAQKRKKIFILSSPTIELDIIDTLWKSSTMKRYFVPCPECGSYHHFELKDFSWTVGEPETIVWNCPSCRAKIKEHQKQNMMLKGEWRATAPQIKNKETGFHINSFMAPYGWISWKEIASQHDNIKGSQERWKSFLNLYCGLPWGPSAGEGTPDPELLYKNNRKDYKRNIVHPDYALLLGSCDVQADRLEVLIDSHKIDGSYCTKSIDHRVFYGDTRNIGDSCWNKLKDLFSETFTVEGSKKKIGISALAIDTGFNTQTVYNFARILKNKRLLLIRGADIDVPVSSPRMVDQNINGVRARNSIRVWNLGVTMLTTELYGWLHQKPDETGKIPYGYCEFPKTYDVEFFKQLCAQQLIMKKNRDGRFKYYYELKTDQKRNEIVDLKVYQRGCFIIAGYDRFNEEHWEAYRKGLCL